MPKRRDWGGWARIHADVPKNGAFCGGCIYCDHEDGACTITSASIWDIGKGGWRKCKHYTLYSVVDTFKYKLEKLDCAGISEYLKEHSAYITKEDYAQMQEVLEEFQSKFQHAAITTNDMVVKLNNALKEDTSTHTVLEYTEATMDKETVHGQDEIQVALSHSLTESEFQYTSYTAYVKYVEWLNDEISLDELFSVLVPLCACYGLKVDEGVLLRVFSFALHTVGKVKGKDGVTVIQRQVRPIATFREFIKGGWKEYVDPKDIQIDASIK